MKHRIFVASVIIVLGLFSLAALAQIKGNYHQKTIAVKDSLVIDTLSIIPQTFGIYEGDVLLDTSRYRLDLVRALLTWRNKPKADSLTIRYRTFPALLSQQSFHKSKSIIGFEVIGNKGMPSTELPMKESTLFNFQGIDKSGSISRSIGFGNNQDLSVNSNMVLQLSGKLSEEIDLLAVISDDNIPIQPDGNTQQINDFDKVFIQLKRKDATLIVGDYELKRPDSYFMNYFKRTQGVYVGNEFKDKNNYKYTTKVAAAVSKGRSARNQFIGEEGNQGPYRLTGNSGEQYIIVLSGTERVFIDGELLLRGQDNDYVIDYNSAEITFTAKRMITRNSRISIEFEYSDKMYGRSLYSVEQRFQSKRLELGFNFYSEQDNPNRPILQTISDEQKEILKQIGNNIDQALVPNVDSVAFNDNEVLYKKVDTLGLSAVYVHSNSPQEAKYRVGFSYVGKNKGNYITDANNVTNGRVYKFVAPIGGEPQGDYEPLTLLITPKKQQLATLNANYQVAKNANLFTEFAISNNDPNLFSEIGNKENQGMAYKLGYQQKNILSKNKSGTLQLNTQVNYEYADSKFVAIERYRPVEFDRDFNYRGTTIRKSDEHWVSMFLQLKKDDDKQVDYKLSTFIRTLDYTGWQHAFNGKYTFKGFRLVYQGSFLNSDQDSLKGQFSRQRVDLSKKWRQFVLGTEVQEENNKTRNVQDNKLSLQSFYFRQFDYYLKTEGESKNTSFQLNYISRLDQSPQEFFLTDYTHSSTYSGKLDMNKRGKSPLSVTASYRTVSYLQQDTISRDEETLLSRIDYNLNLFKGFLNLQSFYELGTGQEPRREYIYLEVPAGQGAYAWKDYNNNGIKELNEFEIAKFPDEARYIRVYRSTNDFIRSNFSNINQTLRLDPAIYLKGKQGFYGFLSKFSSVSVLRINKKVLAGESGLILNPYQTNIDADNLVSLNSFLRNTLFFNRMNPRWGLELNMQSNSAKSMLTNGFDSRNTTEQGFRFRWSFVQKSNFSMELKTGDKNLRSELFSNKNYQIHFIEMRPEFGYQFNQNCKLTLNGGLKSQKNSAIYGGENVTNLNIGSEIRYNLLGKGTLVSQLNFINNNFKGSNNTAISYELLDGLQPGSNMTWTASFQRVISNGIQLNFNYEGRKSNEIKMIHTGGIQVRAFF
ncbi:hypothetical protein [Pseudopedobacter beijingensis]|uniref:Outer membrane protein beta-barrel family protein n=1 Tax=Pseudopedobacter beijingensis TaxID=1207056 RepID=A0ABW4ICF2_9SPHI